MDLKLPGMLGSANLPEVTIHLLHADTAFATPISHCGDDEHEGKVDQFANYAFEVVPSAHIDIATFEEKGLKKATLGATEPTDTICLVFKAIGSCRKSMHCTLLSLSLCRKFEKTYYLPHFRRRQPRCFKKVDFASGDWERAARHQTAGIYYTEEYREAD